LRSLHQVCRLYHENPAENLSWPENMGQFIMMMWKKYQTLVFLSQIFVFLKMDKSRFHMTREPKWIKG